VLGMASEAHTCKGSGYFPKSAAIVDKDINK